MIALRPRQWNRAHAWAGLACVFAALAVWPWVEPIPVPPSSAAGEDRPPTVAAMPSLPPLPAFAAVAERPLFSPTRRPAAAPPSAPVTASRYRLLGVITVGDVRRALLSDGTRRLDVAEGSRFDGGSVRRIEPERVFLSGPEGDIVLELQRAGAPHPPAH